MAILGIYDKEVLLIKALEDLKSNKIEVGEVYSPYPIEKVFEIMGKKSRFHVVTFLFAFLGLLFSYFYVYWTSVVDYPLSYGGKPLHSIPSFIIVGFVSMISTGVLLSFIAFLIRSKFYPGKRQVCPDPRIMDDAFVIYIHNDHDMDRSERQKINRIMKENGAKEIIENNINN